MSIASYEDLARRPLHTDSSSIINFSNEGFTVNGVTDQNRSRISVTQEMRSWLERYRERGFGHNGASDMPLFTAEALQALRSAGSEGGLSSHEIKEMASIQAARIRGMSALDPAGSTANPNEGSFNKWYGERIAEAELSLAGLYALAKGTSGGGPRQEKPTTAYRLPSMNIG